MTTVGPPNSLGLLPSLQGRLLPSQPQQSAKSPRLQFIHPESPRTHLICFIFLSQVILRETGSQYLQPNSVE
ncbi:Hypothetical protein FKW44_022062 [Caligus rogercresseyi]|uniref:Uncharacterized protein n=1 Tax=Caligus rogercresseyi TaxID=217165 RepID=A0A7T8GS93_CALRO|nr:Hypothetical protein FKW44_022062 [Caligus rogercresseyi]